MQLDQTHITIRERGFLEILDLSLQVLRSHWWPLLGALVVGALPLALLNYWLIGHFVHEQTLWDHSNEYMYWMLVLVVWQIPLATAPMTLYLGQATFSQQTQAKHLARDFFGSLPQMIVLQGLLRGMMIPIFVTLLLPYVQWPYLNEIILLERNPLFGKRGRLTTMRRSKSLHGKTGGELFRRWFTSALAAAALCLSVGGALYFFVGHLRGDRLLSTTSWLVCYPLALWLVAGYFAIVRFLAYLDLRIRREGWEVELSLRAEAQRMAEGVIA